MSVKIFYKDGKEETLENCSIYSFENEGFITFEGEDDKADRILIASSIIKRIE